MQVLNERNEKKLGCSRLVHDQISSTASSKMFQKAVQWKGQLLHLLFFVQKQTSDKNWKNVRDTPLCIYSKIFGKANTENFCDFLLSFFSFFFGKQLLKKSRYPRHFPILSAIFTSMHEVYNSRTRLCANLSKKIRTAPISQKQPPKTNRTSENVQNRMFHSCRKHEMS